MKGHWRFDERSPSGGRFECGLAHCGFESADATDAIRRRRRKNPATATRNGRSWRFGSRRTGRLTRQRTSSSSADAADATDAVVVAIRNVIAGFHARRSTVFNTTGNAGFTARPQRTERFRFRRNHRFDGDAADVAPTDAATDAAATAAGIVI